MRFVAFLGPRRVSIPLHQLLRMIGVIPFFGHFALLKLLSLILGVLSLGRFDKRRVHYRTGSGYIPSALNLFEKQIEYVLTNTAL